MIGCEFYRTRRFPFFILALTLIFTFSPACAQLQLPGAPTPAPEGAVAPPVSGAPKPKPKPAGPPPPPRTPNEEDVIGRSLKRNGKFGVLDFAHEAKDAKDPSLKDALDPKETKSVKETKETKDAKDSKDAKDKKGLVVAHLRLAGEQISKEGELCEVDVGGPLTLKPEGKPQGVLRYAVNFPACPFAFDLLDGAVFAYGQSCDFKAANCRVDPAGLWGQPAQEIGANRTKEIERARPQADQNLRKHFREWIKSAGKDHVLVSRIARQQASFSSQREEICRNYARETQHGYCSLTMTQARALAVSARILPPEAPPEEPPTPPSGRRKK